MLFTVSSTGGFYNKTILFSGFKNTHKESEKQETSKKNTVQEFHLCRRMLTNGARRHKLLVSVKIFILRVQKLKVKIYGYNLIRVIKNCCKSFEVLLLKQYRYRDQRQILIYRTILTYVVFFSQRSLKWERRAAEGGRWGGGGESTSSPT
jgi:hypothetical protein